MSEINVDFTKFEKKSYTVLNLILIQKFSTIKKIYIFQIVGTYCVKNRCKVEIKDKAEVNYSYQ